MIGNTVMNPPMRRKRNGVAGYAAAQHGCGIFRRLAIRYLQAGKPPLSRDQAKLVPGSHQDLSLPRQYKNNNLDTLGRLLGRCFGYFVLYVEL
jgi:hypothetical protein